MKRIISLFLVVLILVLSIAPIEANASDYTDQALDLNQGDFIAMSTEEYETGSHVENSPTRG